jgi:hypothetical protein
MESLGLIGLKVEVKRKRKKKEIPCKHERQLLS